MSSFDLIHGRDALVSRWVAKMSGHKSALRNGYGPCSTIGVMQGGKAIAGMVFHNLHRDEGTVELSVASVTPRWFSPRVLGAIEERVRDLGADKLVAWTPLEMERWRYALVCAGGEDHPIPLLGKSFVVIELERWRASRLAQGR